MSYKGKEITNFINQFDPADQNSARLLIDSLVFVSRIEMHRYYRNFIINHYEVNKERIAVFPMNKKYFKRGVLVNKNGVENRMDYDSSVVIGRILKSIEQELGTNKVINVPSVDLIKNDKIKHVVFFDDTIGSGKRVLDFWTNYPEHDVKSIKSLASYKKIQVDFCVYSHSAEGIANITNHSCIKRTRIYSSIGSDCYVNEFDFSIFDLAKKYNKKIFTISSVGFKDSFVPVIFEHGCPNNIPLFFWKSKAKSWNALFPDRSLPPALQAYFGRKGAMFERICNIVSDKGCPQIAIGALSNSGLSEIERECLIPVLALKRLGYSSSRIEGLLLLDKQILHRCLCQLSDLALLEGERFIISENGKRFLKGFEEKVEKTFIKDKDIDKGEFYLPGSFGGASANV